MGTSFFSRSLNKVHNVRLNGGFLDSDVIISFIFVVIQGLVKLGRFSGEDLALSLCLISLTKKLAVSGRIH